ncbi:MAG: single-stranded DNA-binding protein [Candidatus Odinarchaeota archaeon]
MSYESNFEPETHDVKIEDVKPLEKHLNVVFKVIERGEIREITKRDSIGETNRVSDFTVADETGSIILTLWNEDIDSTETDTTYKLSNAFANVFRNSLRLSKGRYGSLEEVSVEFDELNVENDRSAEHHEDPRRRRRYDRYGFGRSSGFDSDRGGGHRRRDDNRRSSPRQRW